MVRSIFFKEWIKTRWVLLLILIIFSAVIIYSFMNVSRGLRVAGSAHIWDMIVQKNITFVTFLYYIPLLSGIMLGISQYSPETYNKRLKLTLHLPIQESRNLLLMLSFGVLSLGVILLVAYATLKIGFGQYFCHEIVDWNIEKITPWLWSGIAAYLLCAWICIEPVWKQRVLNALVSLLIVWLFLFDETPYTYTPFLPYLIAGILLLVGFSFYSLNRFKEGKQ